MTDREALVHVVTQITLVAIGSALGGLLRWGVSALSFHWFGAAFPWGTLAINISGSLFLGWFSTLLTHRLASGWSVLHAQDLQLLVAVGFTGAFTTFSTFELETHKLLHDGHGFRGLIYVAASVVLGLAALRLGIFLAGSK